MNKLLNILLCLILTFHFGYSQVPQGVGYQGVATDANGIELVNQSISIRASVLSGSATGTIEWEETHATTTDTFGLFTLTIGQGTNTTNGAQTSFADISWGTNTHYLKIEMDVTGGSTYSFMGTNQMMSVPYALYAESANINYDSISNLLSNDSTFITNVGGGMGGDGCDYKFPEGINGDLVVIDLLSNNYTVPAGKNLYLTSSLTTGGTAGWLTIGGFTVIQSGNFSVPMIAKSGDLLEWFDPTATNTPTSVVATGILVDENPQVQIISIDLMSGNYTVPSSKKMVLYHAYHEGSTGYINVNGQVVWEAWNRPLPLFLNAGDIVSMTGTPTYASAFGYLVDENYFANCGGGGSSTTSSLDSTTIANMIAGAGGGCDYSFPQGINGTPFVYSFINGDYTVPTGKTLYMLRAGDWGQNVIVSGNTIDIGYPNHNNLIFAEGTEIIDDSSPGSFNGLLLDKSLDVTPITYNIGVSGSPFTVPSGKILYISLVNNWNPIEIDLSGNVVVVAQPGQNGMVFPSQTVLLSNGSPSACFNGYLVDENYFAGCGGGGGSSNSGTGSMSVSTFGDTLTMNGQSIIVPGISFSNVVPTFGSVTDIDGNIYNTIDYGSAGEWMIENLRVTQLNNGTAIPYGLTSGQSTPLYYDYGPGGGYLYNGPAINNNICPSGWHVPSTQEWEDLFNLFSNDLITIVATQNGWLSYISNTLGDQFITNGTNNSYLSIEYGGKAVPNNALDSGLRGWYWSSSTLFSGSENWTLVFEGHEIELDRIPGIDNMQSIRCVKD